jgi:hypothetical protein
LPSQLQWQVFPPIPSSLSLWTQCHTRHATRKCTPEGLKDMEYLERLWPLRPHQHVEQNTNMPRRHPFTFLLHGQVPKDILPRENEPGKSCWTEASLRIEHPQDLDLQNR